MASNYIERQFESADGNVGFALLSMSHDASAILLPIVTIASIYQSAMGGGIRWLFIPIVWGFLFVVVSAYPD